MIRVDTVIEKVRIYRSGAEIVRKGTADLEEGIQTLQVSGMTRTANTTTARLFASGGLSCSNMHIVFPEPENDEDGDYQSLSEELKTVKSRINAKTLQLELWKTNGDFSSRTSQSAAEVMEYIDKLGDRIIALEDEISQLHRQKQSLERKLDELRASDSCPVMNVDVSAAKAGTYTFEFRYFEHNGCWNPVYEIHSDAETSLEIRMKARIYQNTGEDWNEVGISLFAGNPVEYESLPVLEPVYLDFRRNDFMYDSRRFSAAGTVFTGAQLPQAKPGSAFGGYDADYDLSGLMEDTADPGQMTRMETMPAEITQDDSMTEYSLKGTRNIPDSSSGVMADLQNYQIQADYRISAAPSKDLNAYMTARISSAELPFNNAVKADIYLNGMYTGEIYLDPDMTEEYADITLGRQNNVKISHKELARKTHRTMLKGKNVVEYSFETRAANLSDKEITIYLKDQIPVSQNKEITVEPMELSGASLDAETGILESCLKIAAGASETVKLGYRVTAPRDREISKRTESNMSRGNSTGRGTVMICSQCGATVSGAFCPRCGNRVL